MLPITITRDLRGPNAINWPGFVILGTDIPRPAATWAQEAWESRHKLNPANLLRRVFNRSHRRRMEFMGHEVEVQACAILYGLPQAEARRREAESMARGYGGLFDGMTFAQIEAEMLARSVPARAWVMSNIRDIRKHM